jgi:hypothetical protein
MLKAMLTMNKGSYHFESKNNHHPGDKKQTPHTINSGQKMLRSVPIPRISPSSIEKVLQRVCREIFIG